MMANAHVLPYVSGLFSGSQTVDAQQSIQESHMTAYSSHGFRRITGTLVNRDYDVNITSEANGEK